LGSILTNDGRCTCEIKCRTAMVKAAFNKKRALFTSTLDLELRKNLVFSMPPAGFEPTIPAGERPYTKTLDRAATGTGIYT